MARIGTLELWLSQRLFRTSPLVDGPSPSVSVARLPSAQHGFSGYLTLSETLERRWSLTLGVPFDDVSVSCAWVAPVGDSTQACW